MEALTDGARAGPPVLVTGTPWRDWYLAAAPAGALVQRATHNRPVPALRRLQCSHSAPATSTLPLAVRGAIHAAACRRVDYDPAITVQLVAMKKDVRRPPQLPQSPRVPTVGVLARLALFGIRRRACDTLRVSAQAAGRVSELLLHAFPRLERAPFAKGTAGAVLVILPSNGGGWNPMRLAANVLKAGVLIGRLEFP